MTAAARAGGRRGLARAGRSLAALALAVVPLLALVPVLVLAACPAPRGAGPGPGGPGRPADPSSTSPRAAPVPPADLRLPAGVAPTAYRLRLAIDPEQPIFHGEVAIDVTLAAPTEAIWLHAVELTIAEATITLAGTAGTAALPLTITADPAGQRLGLDAGRTLPAGAATLRFRYTGTIVDDDPMGLFRQREGGRWHVYSQMQGLFARRVLPCFDEPGWKVPWQVEVAAPVGLVVVGNGPETARTARADGWTAIALAPTAPMPSYLLAVAVGPFEIVEVGPVGRAAVPTRVLTPIGLGAHAAEAVAATPALVAALETYFDRALPLPKLDLLAVPVFFGAMENLGLITAASSILLEDPARPSRAGRHDLQHTVAHELAHQWFGDLVTPRWWDDLWLNESFATWMAAKIVRQLDPHDDSLAAARRAAERAMAVDSLASARPLRRPIAGGDDVDDSFDAIAYEKGGALLAMFERRLGPERFRTGVRAYIAAHAGGSASAADFVAALAAASEAETAAAFASFLDQPGVPVVGLDLDCTDPAAPAAVATVASDRGAPTWTLPLCVRFPDGAGGWGERCGWIPPTGGRLALPRCPRWLAGNADGAGYYRVAYQPALADAVRAHLRQLAIADRAAIATDLLALVRTGAIDAATVPAWIDALLAAGARHDVMAAAGLASFLGADADDALIPAWRRWVQRRFTLPARRAGLLARRFETVAATGARRALGFLVGASAREPSLGRDARRKVDAWLAGGADPGDDRDLVLAIATATGDLGLHDRLVAAAEATADRDLRGAFLDALARYREPAAIARNHALFLARRFDPREALGLVTGGLGSRAGDAAAWAALTSRYDDLAALLSPLDRPDLLAATGARCTAAARAEVASFFGARADADPRLARALTVALEGIDQCVADRARVQSGIRAALDR